MSSDSAHIQSKYILVSQLCPTLHDPHGLSPTRLLCPWNFPGKNTGVGCHFLFQRIFLTQRSNAGFLRCGQILGHLRHQGSPLPKTFSRMLLVARPQWPQTGNSPNVHLSKEQHRVSKMKSEKKL